ncbi:MAG: hypothetical protein JST89_25710 [Cyanobacteria bacterium SZAS-4]|nr:hypothetical protein [Cyanobacteria bacterium SZAS-4]
MSDNFTDLPTQVAECLHMMDCNPGLRSGIYNEMRAEWLAEYSVVDSSDIEEVVRREVQSARRSYR